jgi:hypothetical protein
MKMRRSRLLVTVVLLVAGVSLAGRQVSGQFRYWSGQNVVPVFEGWERNPDGSFNFVFGYFNRNYEETLDVLVGPDNNVEPGGPDQGQPTFFAGMGDELTGDGAERRRRRRRRHRRGL